MVNVPSRQRYLKQCETITFPCCQKKITKREMFHLNVIMYYTRFNLRLNNNRGLARQPVKLESTHFFIFSVVPVFSQTYLRMQYVYRFSFFATKNAEKCQLARKPTGLPIVANIVLRTTEKKNGSLLAAHLIQQKHLSQISVMTYSTH